jgi:hypothetical protein
MVTPESCRGNGIVDEEAMMCPVNFDCCKSAYPVLLSEAKNLC